MQLSNTTPLQARVLLHETEDPTVRAGLILAKATYRFDASGHLSLDQEQPVPVLLEDQPTLLGLIPRDDLVFCTRHLEVLLLGSARPSNAVQQFLVSVAVGQVRQALLVTGDRCFSTDGRITAPVPFEVMPLVWERAFGGRTEVFLDADASIQVAHATNPDGRGFDPAPAAQTLAAQVYTAPGFPRWSGPRQLPNVEHPDCPVTSPEDDPEPAGFGPVPLASPLQIKRFMQNMPVAEAAENPEILAPEANPEAYHRAAPGLVLPLPPAGAEVRLSGLTPWGEAAFYLPLLRVFVDYRVGARHGTRELAPVRLLLLSDEARFSLLFMHRFAYPFSAGEDRALRLRLDGGWFSTQNEEV